MSGLAFSNTKTTICHSLSYPMTAHFGVAHGQAVSITLAAFLLWNAEAISEKLSPLLQAIGAESVEDAASRIRSLAFREAVNGLRAGRQDIFQQAILRARAAGIIFTAADIRSIRARATREERRVR